ncbi:MAG: riboflavin synthase [bacterium]|nr:riboflavin synthase [bacterium]
MAHDGACMSVTAMGSDRYSFFAMQESFAKTNFGDKQPGDAFNLETCIQADSMLDGHIVTGHIDTTAKLIQTENAEDGSRKLVFSYDPQRDAYVIPKGSIAINGVSLTVVDALPGG